MFTGIIEETGTIRSIIKGKLSAQLNIEASRVTEDIKLGDSINTNGVCLTVVAFNKKGFEVDVMAETIRRTNLKDLVPGSRVNLERALKLSDRLGGHMVSGHIDNTGTISGIQTEDNATWISISTRSEVTKYIVEKGSIALDGISLTVVEVRGDSFSVSVIPHTAKETTLLEKKVGDSLNIECDISAKYIEKFLCHKKNKSRSEVDYNFLNKHGYID